MNKIHLIILFVLLFSCKEKEAKFEQSEVYKSVFLIKNAPKNDSLLKKNIVNFLLENSSVKNQKNYYRMVFYKYTNDMSYFLKNKEYDGFGAKALSTHNADNLAEYIISRCKKDSTKFVGELYFYGLKGLDEGKETVDTIIYHCK